MKRDNIILEVVFSFLFSLSAIPSYIVEVFLRRKFGSRYFTSSYAILISIVMFAIYFFGGDLAKQSLGFTWAIFTGLFLWKSIKHRLEITKYGVTYDFERFSLSDGESWKFWDKLIGNKIAGITITRYLILVVLEPAVPVLTGLLLMPIPFTRGVGFLLFTSGLLFGFRSFMKTQKARNHILDMIDEQLAKKWKHDVLVEQKPKSETAGFSLPVELPSSRKLRQDLCNAMDSDGADMWEDDLPEPEPSYN